MVIIGISQVEATAITKAVTCQLNDIHNYQPGLTRSSRGQSCIGRSPQNTATNQLPYRGGTLDQLSQSMGTRLQNKIYT